MKTGYYDYFLSIVVLQVFVIEGEVNAVLSTHMVVKRTTNCYGVLRKGLYNHMFREYCLWSVVLMVMLLEIMR